MYNTTLQVHSSNQAFVQRFLPPALDVRSARPPCSRTPPWIPPTITQSIPLTIISNQPLPCSRAPPRIPPRITQSSPLKPQILPENSVMEHSSLSPHSISPLSPRYSLKTRLRSILLSPHSTSVSSSSMP
jgi:hypothetical protein